MNSTIGVIFEIPRNLDAYFGQNGNQIKCI